MKNRRKGILPRVKAFTIMELIIVMLISSIAISLVYGIISQSNALIDAKNDANQDYLDLLQLHTCLKSEISAAKTLKMRNNTLSIINDKRLIDYCFENENYIIREELGTDTFFLAHGDVESNLNKETENSRVIQDFAFSVYFRSDSISMYYYRGISINDLISNNDD